jgi:hypothetical protein
LPPTTTFARGDAFGPGSIVTLLSGAILGIIAFAFVPLVLRETHPVSEMLDVLLMSVILTTIAWHLSRGVGYARRWLPLVVGLIAIASRIAMLRDTPGDDAAFIVGALATEIGALVVTGPWTTLAVIAALRAIDTARRYILDSIAPALAAALRRAITSARSSVATGWDRAADFASAVRLSGTIHLIDVRGWVVSLATVLRRVRRMPG